MGQWMKAQEFCDILWPAAVTEQYQESALSADGSDKSRQLQFHPLLQFLVGEQ